MSDSFTLLVFPHQLFDKHPGLTRGCTSVVLIEDSLFFGDAQYPAHFHKQKLWFHRATMKQYAERLEADGYAVEYRDHATKKDALKSILRSLKKAHGSHFKTTALHDYTLEKRLKRSCDELGLTIDVLPTPMFLNTPETNVSYRSGKKRWYMADFYKFQRRRLNVLMEGDSPAGGKWSYDEDNRKKLPKKLIAEIPEIPSLTRSDIDLESSKYIQKKYGDNPGQLDELIFPTTHKASKRWLKSFLDERFSRFGDYEDAIVEGQNWLWHSVLTPMLNVGLLTPDVVLKQAIASGAKNNVPLNALEGFVRQVIGWREFMRATYEDLGVTMRTTNHWGHTRAIPASFYEGTTGILPVDDVIQRILKTGYCHHIERLMVLGGFMFLCEFDPDDIYRWFMEMFVDSYDWVMVPNVYAMSQNADGGLITTKPYFSGSSYIKKMSHYRAGEWATVWDALYWRWIWNHTDELAKNPRWAMMCSMARKMDPAKMNAHLETAERYLKTLS